MFQQCFVTEDFTCAATRKLPPMGFLRPAHFRETTKKKKAQINPDLKPEPSCLKGNRAVSFLEQTPVPPYFLLKISHQDFPFTQNDLLFSASSSPLLTHLLTLLVSFHVTQPIWVVWWSWVHRSLSGELSGALLKTQRADYSSCQSH